ncbi:hypothetical protein ACLKA7_004004 [Drosophila subpalustris]
MVTSSSRIQLCNINLWLQLKLRVSCNICCHLSSGSRRHIQVAPPPSGFCECNSLPVVSGNSGHQTVAGSSCQLSHTTCPCHPDPTA